MHTELCQFDPPPNPRACTGVKSLTILTFKRSRDDSGGGGYNKPIQLNPTISTSNAPTTKLSNKKKLKKQMSDKVSNLLQSKKSWLTSTTYFTKAIDSSFDMIDVDKSGDVTLEELYAGLLLIHLKMAVYVGSPACRVCM